MSGIRGACAQLAMGTALATSAVLAFWAFGCSSTVGSQSSPSGSDGGGTDSGSGSEVGGPDSGSPEAAQGCTVDPSAGPCATCTAQQCCAEEQACANDEACDILLRCLLACNGDLTCVNACGSSVPMQALTELTNALDCSEKNCQAQCNGTTTDAGCGSTPTLHPSPAGSIYCDPQLTCTTGQQCCLGGSLGNGQYAPDTCTSLGSTCTNGGSPDAGGAPGLPIECMKVADCTANGMPNAMACCLQGATQPTDPAGCTYPRSILGSDVVCETSACGAGEVQLCESSADCPAGKTCTAGKWKIYQVGFCL